MEIGQTSIENIFCVDSRINVESNILKPWDWYRVGLLNFLMTSTKQWFFTIGLHCDLRRRERMVAMQAVRTSQDQERLLGTWRSRHLPQSASRSHHWQAVRSQRRQHHRQSQLAVQERASLRVGCVQHFLRRQHMRKRVQVPQSSVRVHSRWGEQCRCPQRGRQTQKEEEAIDEREAIVPWQLGAHLDLHQPIKYFWSHNKFSQLNPGMLWLWSNVNKWKWRKEKVFLYFSWVDEFTTSHSSLQLEHWWTWNSCVLVCVEICCCWRQMMKNFLSLAESLPQNECCEHFLYILHRVCLRPESLLCFYETQMIKDLYFWVNYQICWSNFHFGKVAAFCGHWRRFCI